ncbi:MAG: universal stress protein [Proteobacteria bacterium]|nr:universal stress protein [Pseudomonadota bacterium]MBU1581465.1 universal stress protein [Pseudomonadota bacterium]MBU2454326.1 universal stress protein [Pseudomonadota bacterium]MBU2627330.1 universal stress protein [Pseudomonadota bacterium]
MSIKILVPHNFTANDEKAIDFVGQMYAGKKEIEVTFFHAFNPPPEIDTRNNPIMDKMGRNLSYLRQQQEERKNALEAAKKKLMNYGFPDHHIQCLFLPIKRDIAEDIIQLWKQEKFDVVVLNRNPGNIAGFFSRSISKKITRQNEGRIKVHIVN